MYKVATLFPLATLLRTEAIKEALIESAPYKLNNTQVCDECLFGQVSTCTSFYQLPILHCKMRTRVDMLAHYLGTPSLDDVMSHNGLTTVPLCTSFI